MAVKYDLSDPLVNDWFKTGALDGLLFKTNDHAWKGTVKSVLFQSGLKKKKCFSQKRNGLIDCKIVSSRDGTSQILSETLWSKVMTKRQKQNCFVESESYPANDFNCVVGTPYLLSCMYTWRKASALTTWPTLPPRCHTVSLHSF